MYLSRGHALRQGSSWRGSRGLVALLLVALSVGCASLWLYMSSQDGDVTETLVRRSELVSPQPRVYHVPCSEDYDNYKRYPGKHWAELGLLLGYHDTAETDRLVYKKERLCKSHLTRVGRLFFLPSSGKIHLLVLVRLVLWNNNATPRQRCTKIICYADTVYNLPLTTSLCLLA